MSRLPAIVIIGGGGHGKVVLEAVLARGAFEPIGIVDPNSDVTHVLGLPVLGADDILPKLIQDGVIHAAVAIGDNRARHRIGETVKALGFQLPPIIHPAALISPSASIAPGAVIMAGAVIGTQVSIGELAIINTGAIVDHDSQVGVAAHVAPGCALAGNVHVGARVLIGIGGAVKPGIRVGDDAIVGAGSAVVRDVPAGGMVAGAPARPIGV